MSLDCLKALELNLFENHKINVKRKELYLDNEISLDIEISKIQNMCHINANTSIELMDEDVVSLLDLLNATSRTGWYRYDKEKQLLELLTTIWIENILDSSTIQEVVDTVLIEFSVNHLLLLFMGNKKNGKRR